MASAARKAVNCFASNEMKGFFSRRHKFRVNSALPRGPVKENHRAIAVLHIFKRSRPMLFRARPRRFNPGTRVIFVQRYQRIPLRNFPHPLNRNPAACAASGATRSTPVCQPDTIFNSPVTIRRLGRCSKYVAIDVTSRDEEREPQKQRRCDHRSDGEKRDRDPCDKYFERHVHSPERLGSDGGQIAPTAGAQQTQYLTAR